MLDFMGVLCGGSVLLMGTDTQQAKRVICGLCFGFGVRCILNVSHQGQARMAVRFFSNGHGHPTSQAGACACVFWFWCALDFMGVLCDGSWRWIKSVLLE